MDIVNPIVKNRMRAGLEDSDAFWDSAARELPWLKTWDTVYEADYPTFRWFVGAQTNLSYMCVDHQTASGRGGHAAFIYASERGVRQIITYAQLQRQVERAAAALRGMGLRKGDRLTIYMPNALETVVLMLATVRIGAIHSIVFAGFSAPALGRPHPRQWLAVRLLGGRGVPARRRGQPQKHRRRRARPRLRHRRAPGRAPPQRGRADDERARSLLG